MTCHAGLSMSEISLLLIFRSVLNSGNFRTKSGGALPCKLHDRCVKKICNLPPFSLGLVIYSVTLKQLKSSIAIELRKVQAGRDLLQHRSLRWAAAGGYGSIASSQLGSGLVDSTAAPKR